MFKIITAICTVALWMAIGQSPDPWLLGFQKPAENPVLTADSSFSWFDPVTQKIVKWQRADVFNPAAIVVDDTVYLFYRAEDNPKASLGARTSRIGLAKSTDGIHFIKENKPVLYPDSSQYLAWDYPGGCEDPRVVKGENGLYIMTYTSWNQKIARLSIATSKDLRKWRKQGPAFFKARNGKFIDTWSKSGAIVTRIIDGQQTAVKIDDKYWMYWGDTDIFLATSQDLINWDPFIDNNGKLIPVLTPRNKMFDSQLVEPGPPALLTGNGILLFYNGRNTEGAKASPNLAPFTYCGGQAVFDATDPTKLIDRMNKPFICPDLPHEITGQYKAGTTFTQALVPFKNKWYLYYGTADSMVGLAISDEKLD